MYSIEGPDRGEKVYTVPKFSASMDTSEPEIEIIWVDEEKRHLLPPDMQPTPEELRRWLFRRTIPKNRAFVHEFLAKCGLNLNRPMHIISVCKGLSLNDCYWVVPEDFEGTFAKNNLYDNSFSNALALHLIEQQIQKRARLLERLNLAGTVTV